MKFGRFFRTARTKTYGELFLNNHEKICKTLTAKKYLSNVAQWE